MIKQVGNYEIEYPTTVNDHKARRTAFIRPINSKARDQRSQFITVYDNGRIAVDYRVPQYVWVALSRMVREK